jgi:hypothetical protein
LPTFAKRAAGRHVCICQPVTRPTNLVFFFFLPLFFTSLIFACHSFQTTCPKVYRPEQSGHRERFLPGTKLNPSEKGYGRAEGGGGALYRAVLY